MAREFNIQFNDVTMDNADNLLENTRVTSVTLVGDNKFVSLDSAFKDCNELLHITGEIDLSEISDIDYLLYNAKRVESIILKNIINENITAINAFPNVLSITLMGEIYNKIALQNIISMQEWFYEGFNYEGTVKENIFINVKEENNTEKLLIQDTLEQKAISIEIYGESYENLINGKDEIVLKEELILDFSNEIKEITPNTILPVYIREIDGCEQGLGELQEDGTYKIDIRLDNDYERLWEEL